MGCVCCSRSEIRWCRCKHTSSSPHYTHSQGFGEHLSVCGELSHFLRPANRSSACENAESPGSEGYRLRGIRMYEFEFCASDLERVI